MYIVTKRQLANFLDISERRITQLQTEKIIHRNAEAGGYDLKECTRAYWEYKLNSETGRKTAITKEQMQAEHEKVKMDISKLKLSRLRRESFDGKAIVASWADMLTGFKNRMKSLPSKMAMATADKDINESIVILDEMIDEALNDLANYDPKEVEEMGLSAFEDDEEEEGDDE